MELLDMEAGVQLQLNFHFDVNLMLASVDLIDVELEVHFERQSVVSFENLLPLEMYLEQDFDFVMVRFDLVQTFF